jgi:L-ascorbate metabolism protein UlaG (beta-lactamase superfamily)
MRCLARSLLAALVLALVGLPGAPSSARPTLARDQPGMVTVEWLGWNFYRFTSPSGKVVLVNPFVANPDAPISLSDITRADLILVTNGHPDEVGQAIEIAQQTGARIVVGSFGWGNWFVRNGIPSDQVIRSNPGQRVQYEGITIRVVQGIHGSDLLVGTSRNNPVVQSIGITAAFVITFENGWTLYYGGSSAATHDQALVGELYQPDAAIIYMADGVEPMDFAAQVRFLMTDNPSLVTVFPGHHRFVQQGGATTVAEVQEALRKLGVDLMVTEPAPGQSYSYTK